jgi:predicted nucleotidyltransferase component of viral defense system
VHVELNPDLFLDVAEEFGISEPCLVEKDYHVTQVLSLLSKFQSEYFVLVFAGGTCLSKTIDGLGRMSEDIDLKLVPTTVGQQLSKSKLRSELSNVKKSITKSLLKFGYQSTIIKEENGNQHIEWEVEYKAVTDSMDALRPNIQVETTFCEDFSNYKPHTFGSMIATTTGNELEVQSILCVDATYTAAEKIVSLLRRVSGIARGRPWDDDRLIRHVYDVDFLFAGGFIHEKDLISILENVIGWDGQRFANSHKEFNDTPLAECEYSLGELANNPLYEQNYKDFLGPLVYAANANPDFQEALKSISTLFELFVKGQNRF